MFKYPRKRFGQHFLRDKRVLYQIIQATKPELQDHFVEIGPGRGALTSILLPLVKQLDAIEIDCDLITYLENKFNDLDHFHLHQGDALIFSFDTLVKSNEKLRIIGNLPYNISTPLLFHLLEFSSYIKDMHLMLQQEVAERIVAKPNSKQYGRLSVMIQYFCDTKLLFKVSKASFFPPPRVMSCVLRLTPRPPLVPADDINLFAELVKISFQHRRKTLRNSLKALLAEEEIRSASIDPNARAENLSVNEFVRLAGMIDKQNKA